MAQELSCYEVLDAIMLSSATEYMLSVTAHSAHVVVYHVGNLHKRD